MPMPPPFLSKQQQQGQGIDTSPTSVTANLAAETIDYHNVSDQQKFNKRSDTDRKRCVKMCIAIAILCALWLQGVQTLQIQETSAQAAQSIQKIVLNETKFPENNHNGEMIDDMPPIPQPQRKIRFIPYPHRTLGSGASMQCQWETRPISNASTTSTSQVLDFTQLNAYTEGVCIPPTLSDTLHIFSSEEAIQCLSSEVQNRDIRVILSGDSYMKQLYIGLADILLSKHITDDKQMRDSAQRAKVLSTAQYWMKKRREKNATFPFVQYQCAHAPNVKDVYANCSK